MPPGERLTKGRKPWDCSATARTSTEELAEHNKAARDERHKKGFELRAEAVRQGRDDLVKEIDETQLFDAG